MKRIFNIQARPHGMFFVFENMAGVEWVLAALINKVLYIAEGDDSFTRNNVEAVIDNFPHSIYRVRKYYEIEECMKKGTPLD